MTNNIYPPDHLLRKWESLIIDEEQNVDVVLYEAFQAGADQELEACCEWINRECGNGWGHGTKLRAARRPKPPSLKEQALEILEINNDVDSQLNAAHYNILRLALESLPD
jgi:hypothetical protein